MNNKFFKKYAIQVNDIIFCCKDCGGKITYRSAFYGNGRCNSCAKKDNLHHLFGKHPSNATLLKMSKSHKGKTLSNKTRIKISNAHLGKVFSKETRKKLSDALIGKFIGKISSAWQGGISFFPYSIVFTNQLKEQIRKRDNYTCQYCDLKEIDLPRKLDVHHIDYNKENCNHNNLISLCRKCHTVTNGNRDYWFAYFTYLME
jgi:hypothetical protein